ncbi:MAG TPA: O-antigen ligase family protein [Hyphomicrobiaceae bacterium]|nr:O-antigen ligase family protein [Hyphomicrobiaceae bacterium]
MSLADLARLAVFLSVVAGGIVLWEPAPVDAMMLGLVVLLPLAGLQKYSRDLVAYLLLWLVCGAGALLASGMSLDLVRSGIHTGVSFYLYIASFTLAAFIACRPDRHVRLVIDATVVAATLATIAALVGYFRLVPGAFELFTRFGRAAGTFKDPNVYGAFIVPAVLYMLHIALGRRRFGLVLPLSAVGLFGLGLLLSFSRGAWLNLALSTVVYAYLAYITAGSRHERKRIIRVAAGAALAAAALLLAASQVDSISALLEERSSLAQGYDVGREGRFGGQQKAIDLVLSAPLGIGATEFSARHHHEDVHNVYLSMFLNAGWLGGLAYIFVVVLSIVRGLAHILRATVTRPLFIVAYAAFVGTAMEGAVIDTDHWRHFYILLAILWGLMAGEGRER